MRLPHEKLRGIFDIVWTLSCLGNMTLGALKEKLFSPFTLNICNEKLCFSAGIGVLAPFPLKKKSYISATNSLKLAPKQENGKFSLLRWRENPRFPARGQFSYVFALMNSIFCTRKVDKRSCYLSRSLKYCMWK